MTAYVILAKYTDAGVKAIKESPARLDTAKRLLKGWRISIVLPDARRL